MEATECLRYSREYSTVPPVSLSCGHVPGMWAVMYSVHCTVYSVHYTYMLKYYKNIHKNKLHSALNITKKESAVVNALQHNNLNDNSTNHVYIHDFMYVYMFLQNRTSRLRQV